MATLDERTLGEQEWGTNGFYYENSTTSADTSSSSNAAYNQDFVFCALHILDDTKFHTLTFLNTDSYKGDLSALANSTSSSADTLPAGTVIYGYVSGFQLHSGKVMAYYAGAQRNS
jgi:hypothetical protein|tara:strand:- start:16 stop:363 length:348 start_codon:yes stop_codon:yes gene_type:complete